MASTVTSSRLDALEPIGPPASKRRRLTSSAEPGHAPDEWSPPVAEASARPIGGTDAAAAGADDDDAAAVYGAFALGVTFVSRLAVDEAFEALCARFGRDKHKLGIYADPKATITPALNLKCGCTAHNPKSRRGSKRCVYVRLSARSGSDLGAWSVVLFNRGLNDPGPSSPRASTVSPGLPHQRSSAPP